MRAYFWIVGVLVLFTGGVSTRAQETSKLPAEIVVGVGAINALDNSANTRWLASLEYRFREIDWHIRPWVGLAQSERDTRFVSAGLVYSYQTAKGWRLSVGWAPTYYDRRGGQNLGSDLEFYSFGEIGYVFKNRQLVGVRVGHLSNGGFSKPNPGTETLLLTYSLPLGR